MGSLARIIKACIFSMLILSYVSVATAQDIPGMADPSRVLPRQQPTAPTASPGDAPAQYAPSPSVTLPYDANAPQFILKSVNVVGASLLSPQEIKRLFYNYEMKNITTNTINELIRTLTAYYHTRGYFLTRVYLPEQEIKDGVVTLGVVEGYVGQVELEDALPKTSVADDLINELIAQKPLTSAALESFLLQVNDLPGYKVIGVLESADLDDEAAVKLHLKARGSDTRASVSINNYGSRYLGPVQANAAITGSLMPLHETSLALATSLPTDELAYASLRHSWAFAPRLRAEVFGGYVTAEPGYRLTASEITSDTADMGVKLAYQAIRQRDMNLNVAVQLDAKNTDGDTFDNPLTRDRIRAARAMFAFDNVDGWNGQNIVNLTLSHGLSGLGASSEGDSNLSRAEATPDFKKIELWLTRQQYLGHSLLLTAQLAGQYASDPLFSAEEFGYGGMQLGRAYDPSEIIGDHGIAAGVMLTYTGFESWMDVAFEPYAFYDIGRVWNEDIGSDPESGSSAGVGLRASHADGYMVDFTVAQPLTRAVADPTYGNGKNPRYLIEVKKSF